MHKPAIIFNGSVKGRVQWMKKFCEPRNDRVFEVCGVIPLHTVCTFSQLIKYNEQVKTMVKRTHLFQDGIKFINIQ
jgi:hypothetical protein